MKTITPISEYICDSTGDCVPVIGIVRAGDQAMADRFTYVPSIGLGIMAAWSIGELARRGGRSWWLATAAVVVVVGAAGLRARDQLGELAESFNTMTANIEAETTYSIARTMLVPAALRYLALIDDAEVEMLERRSSPCSTTS